MITEHDTFYLTSVFGVTAERQFYRKRAFVNDGSQHAVNATERDTTLASYDEVRKELQFRAYFMTGFSF